MPPAPPHQTMPQKASLRGVSHNFAAVAAAAAGLLLFLDAPTPRAKIGTAIYAITLTAMFSISAAYHRPTWSPSARGIMRKLDHAGIYGIIAGTYTPLCLLALDKGLGDRLLLQVWTGATVGILQSVFSKSGAGSKVISAILYIALGWIVLPYSHQLELALGGTSTALLVAGGIIYSVGAVIYAARWPDPAPSTFGYHELFHAAVILAAVLHFGAVRHIVHAARETAQCPSS